MDKKINTFADLLEEQRGSRHAIILHEYPDPDAIASGYAQRLISANYEIEADIFYTGEISHQQNLALARALDCDLISYEPNLDFKPYQREPSWSITRVPPPGKCSNICKRKKSQF